MEPWPADDRDDGITDRPSPPPWDVPDNLRFDASRAGASSFRPSPKRAWFPARSPCAFRYRTLSLCEKLDEFPAQTAGAVERQDCVDELSRWPIAVRGNVVVDQRGCMIDLAVPPGDDNLGAARMEQAGHHTEFEQQPAPPAGAHAAGVNTGRLGGERRRPAQVAQELPETQGGSPKPEGEKAQPADGQHTERRGSPPGGKQSPRTQAPPPRSHNRPAPGGQ